MTPLELAKRRTAVKTCMNCAYVEIIGGVYYCKKSGKIIHPYLLDGVTKCPHDKGAMA